MITADQLVAHAIGDYLLQSDWMATRKRTDNGAAMVHAMVYTLCFLPWLLSPAISHGSAFLQTLVICLSHFYIDRYGLARYVVWAKNFLAPRWLPAPLTAEQHDAYYTLPAEMWRKAFAHRRNPSWRECVATGYPPDRPPFLAVWLLIIADNLLHVVINALALRFL